MTDPTYNTINYGEQGGERWVVGGELAIVSGGTLSVSGGATSPTETQDANFTLTSSDSGKTIIIDAADVVATLPATAAGVTYTFIVKTLSSTTGFSVSPAAADAIHGNGLTSVDDKDLINTAASDAEGDTVTIIGDGVDGWWITSIVGTWAKEA
jgi:hypothetical protein